VRPEISGNTTHSGKQRCKHDYYSNENTEKVLIFPDFYLAYKNEFIRFCPFVA
jgi:hypothetical protein